MKKIYVCGPTVYSDVHIGNMRPTLTFDFYFRALKHLGEEFKYVQNITDIDDKIINKSKELNITELELAKNYTQIYTDLLKQANIIMPNEMPSVINNMDNIVLFIKKIIKSGFAYVSGGSVYLDVLKVKKYGVVSNQKIDNLKSIDNSEKKNNVDFALWKKTSDGLNFLSPWSEGRPGWHTECAYFIDNIFNSETIDIHAGGIDLIFPHHENENAQYQSLNNKPIAKEWKHLGLLNMDGTKMSKSLGNVLHVKDFIVEYSFDILKYIFLKSSYSAPLNITDDLILESKNAVAKLENTFNKMLFENVKEINIAKYATLLKNFSFSEYLKELNSELKKYNSKLSNGEILFSMIKLLGLSFSRNIVSEKDTIIYKKWIKLKLEKKYDAADELKKELKKIKCFFE